MLRVSNVLAGNVTEVEESDSSPWSLLCCTIGIFNCCAGCISLVLKDLVHFKTSIDKTNNSSTASHTKPISTLFYLPFFPSTAVPLPIPQHTQTPSLVAYRAPPLSRCLSRQFEASDDCYFVRVRFGKTHEPLLRVFLFATSFANAFCSFSVNSLLLWSTSRCFLVEPLVVRPLATQASYNPRRLRDSS